MCSIEGSSQSGWPKFPQPSEWTNFLHATLCLAQWNDGKIILTSLRYLTQDYRKEKEESKETMALEVVTDGKNDKTEKND